MKKTILLLIMSISLFGCSQDAIEDILSNEDYQRIANEGNTLIEDVISKALNDEEQIDPATFCAQFATLEGVTSAEIDPTGTNLYAILEDGRCVNYSLVYYPEDEESAEEASAQEEYINVAIKTKSLSQDYNTPKGEKKALILAPTKNETDNFLISYNPLITSLEDAGYDVDTYYDQDATIDRFRGNFLCQYDIIIIQSHMGPIKTWLNKEEYTGIVTGTDATQESFDKLPEKEKKYLAISIDYDNKGRETSVKYAVTSAWIRATTTKQFYDSWVFAAGCSSTYLDDMYSTFFSLGAGAYSGFSCPTLMAVVGRYIKETTYLLLEGKNLYDVSHTVRENNPAMAGPIQWLTLPETERRFDAKQKHEDNPFYLVVPEGYQRIPSVEINNIQSFTSNSADFSCEVTFSGAAKVTAKGVCWSTTPNPTTSNSKTTNGTGVGTYTSHITGLSPNTTYYVRAYATNSQGTAYGEQRTFRTLTASDIEYGSFTDSRDGIVYKTVTIGEQVWMAENLAYLPSVSLPSSGSYGSPYYYVYDYNTTNVADAKATINYQTYGVLYNWPAAMNGASASNANPSGVQGVCPEGWHLPSDEEWTQLETYLARNGYQYDGSTDVANIGGLCPHLNIAAALVANIGWESSTNEGAAGNTDYPEYRNKSGFSALPGGYRGYDGKFYSIGIYGCWWCTTFGRTLSGRTYPLSQRLYYNSSDLNRRVFDEYNEGFSVRCLRD